MQVFKLYWKLLRANLRSFFIYVGIFSGLLFGVIIPQQTKDTQVSYADTKCSFAVLDEDGSEASGGITDYLSQNHKLKELKNYELETIQDQLFYRNVDAVLIYKEGFENALKKKKAEDYVEIYVIPNTMSASLFETDYNSFATKLSAYLDGKYSMEEALKRTAEVCNTEMKVGFLEGENTSGRSAAYSFFVYLSWIFLAVCIQSVSPVLGIMDQKEVKNRVYVSSYKFSAFNLETLLGIIITGIVMCILFLGIAAMVLPDPILNLKGGLWMLNMLCFMVIAMGFTLLVSKITTNGQVISAISNVISLGMAFTCGVFVPMEFLGEGVIRFAHFLPAYWYVQAVDLIGNYTSDKLGMIFAYFGIELLFGGVIIAVAFLISRKKVIV